MGALVTKLAFCFCNDLVRTKKAGTVSRFAEADPDMDCQESIWLDHKDISTVDHDIIWHLNLDILEVQCHIRQRPASWCHLGPCQLAIPVVLGGVLLLSSQFTGIWYLCKMATWLYLLSLFKSRGKQIPYRDQTFGSMKTWETGRPKRQIGCNVLWTQTDHDSFP